MGVPDTTDNNGVSAAIAAGKLIGQMQAGKGAGIRENPHPHGLPFILLKGDDGLEEVKYLERPASPPRRAGLVAMHDTESFLEFWKRQATPASYVYGSIVPTQFVAIINENGEPTAALDAEADWRDYRIGYALEHSREWNAWAEHDKKPFKTPEELAFFLEDNLPDLDPVAQSNFIDIVLNMKVSGAVGFQRNMKLQNGSLRLAYTHDVNAESTVGNESLAIPEKFGIKIPVFQGMQAPLYDIEARFRWAFEPGKLFLRYELVRPRKVEEQAFKDILAKIEAAIGKPVLFGKP